MSTPQTTGTPSLAAQLSQKNPPPLERSALVTREEWPDAALLTIFRFLSPQDLHRASTVQKRWQQFSSLIISPGGSKYDNLVKTQAALPAGVASVPPFFKFTDAQGKTLLSPETRALWQELGQMWKTDKSPLNEWPFLSIINRLQKSVEKDILSAELSASQKKMLAAFAGERLMVRSSSNEDTQNAVNAGGNLSLGAIEPTEEGVKRALSKVIASYFGAHSLNNRSAFEDPFRAMPSCETIIMVQIDGESIVSGVMMTHKSAWFQQREERVPHIVASWGFGGGVVSGSTPSDEWVLTENQCYPTIRYKAHRMITLPGGDTQEVSNAPELRESPCLTEIQIKRLQTAGRCLEEYFRHPMDVEFVIRGEDLYIVQARQAQAPEMTAPTFLDPSTIPASATRFQSINLIPGTSQVLTLRGKHVLFEKDLETADKSYNPKRHRAVVVYTPPASNNSHPEVNFSSQRPPVPCFLLPHEAWKMCKEIDSHWHTKEYLHLCPQTGMLVIAAGDLPMRKGLFLHPARLSISVDARMPGLQSTTSTHPRIEYLQRLLTNTPDRLSAHLGPVQEELTQLFADISSRTATQTEHLQPVAKRLQRIAMSVFHAMQGAAKKKHPILLSFHAGALRQLLKQTNRQVVGAHSLAGLESATQLPIAIESFVETHQGSPVLCELAMLAKKAWDAPLQHNWLSFLEKNHREIRGEHWGALLTRLQELDAIGMTSLWFAIHFSGEVQPTMERLLTQEAGEKEFLTQCLDFAGQWRHLTERVERMHTVSELAGTWDTLQKQTRAFLEFCSTHPRRNLLQTLQLSQVSYDLIQLWDAQIKIVRTSKLLPESEVEGVFKDRIDAFALFGLAAIEHGAIAVGMSHRGKLKNTLKRFSTERFLGSSKKFSVQHWIVPLQGFAPPNNEARFTIIHQNLLRASAPAFSDDRLRLLPLALVNAVRTFQGRALTQTKRREENRGTFMSISEESASVTINIPLNYHSFVITMHQSKGSETVDVTAYWKGTDNDQGVHFEFIQLYAAIVGITLKGYSRTAPDLQVIFPAANVQQMYLISLVIDYVNHMSLHGIHHFNSLIGLLHPYKEGKSQEEYRAGAREARIRILDFVWKQFTDTGTMPDFMKREFDRNYLEEKGLLPLVVARVLEEVGGRRPGSVYSEIFFDIALKTLPIQGQKKILWLALMGWLTGKLKGVYLIESLNEDILRRLYYEAPVQALNYCHYGASQFNSLMNEIVATGGPKSLDQAKVLRFCYQEAGEKAPALWAEALKPWDAELSKPE